MHYSGVVHHIDGIIPEETEALFLSQHMAAYVFARRLIRERCIIEIGFGEGYGAHYLAEAAQQVTGVDIAPGNAERAAQKYQRPNLTFESIKGLHYRFADANFDAACSFQVIEHIPEPLLLTHLQEVRRILKRGGFYFVSTLNLANAMKPGKPYKKIPEHEKEFTGPELKALLERVFERVELHGLYPSCALRIANRLKKWGVDRWGTAASNPLVRFYRSATTNYFFTRPAVSPGATDLFAIAYKEPSSAGGLP
jgi:SAM-dependent methyltransferase